MKTMYKKPSYTGSKIINNEGTEGETIEQKIERIVQNKEPIKDGAPEIFTERSEGVIQAYNIRTDRWEVAVDAMDIVHKNSIAKRMGNAEKEVIKLEPDAKGESTGGTEQ